MDKMNDYYYVNDDKNEIAESKKLTKSVKVTVSK